jgi:hypothetical protein
VSSNQNSWRLGSGGSTAAQAVEASHATSAMCFSVATSVSPIASIGCARPKRGGLEKLLIRRFWRCRLIGLNLSMRATLNESNSFDYLIERDSSVGGHSDLMVASVQPSVSVVGVCLVEDYPQGDTRVANAAVEGLIQAESAAVIRIDTRLDLNSAGRTDWKGLRPFFCGSVSAVSAAPSAPSSI